MTLMPSIGKPKSNSVARKIFLKFANFFDFFRQNRHNLSEKSPKNRKLNTLILSKKDN